MLNLRRFLLMILFFLITGILPPRTGSALPAPKIVMHTPGPGSEVIAPIEILADLQVNTGDFVRVNLTNTHKIDLARQLHPVQSPGGLPLAFRTALDYEIPSDSENALLSLSIHDHFNRPVAIRTVFLALRTDRQPEIAPITSQATWLEVNQPQPGDLISGGEVAVVGQVRPITEGPVFFDLMTESGSVIGGLQLAVKTPGKNIEFKISVPYGFITRQRDILLIIRQASPQFGANIILDSIPITLLP
jgi:hypothetical protein